MKPINHALLALSLAAACAAGCKPHDPSTSAAPVLTTAVVRVQTVEARKHLFTEETVGTIRAKLQARLEAKIPGRIEQMRAVPGQSVKAGELLARLDAREVRARLDQALALRQQAQSDLQRSTALLDRAAATPAEFDAVQARARVAEAAVQEAQTMLGHAEVVAPFDGVVTRKLADVGDLAAPGKPLVDVEDPTRLRLETDIPETLIGAIKLGATMPVRLSQGSGPAQGTVSEISPSADPNSRTFRVTLDLPSAEGWRAGQFGRVTVPVGETSALRVPVSAVVQRGQLHLVFVVADKRAVMRLVKPGQRLGGEIEIASGLAQGESVVVVNAASLIDGQPVEIEP